MSSYIDIDVADENSCNRPVGGSFINHT